MRSFHWFRLCLFFSLLAFALAACQSPVEVAEPTSQSDSEIASSTPIAPTATSPAATNSPSATPFDIATSLPAATSTPAAAADTATSFPSSTPTQIPAQTSTPAAPTAPAATATTAAASPSSTPNGAALAIDSFEITSIETLNPGRRITFSWSASGDLACIVSGTAQRLGPWWPVPLSGTLTVEVSETHFRDPDFTLQVYEAGVICHVPGPPPASEPVVTASVPVEWDCALDYFFSPAPRRCPLEAATTSQAVEQHFEHGRMVWFGADSTIYVFYDSGQYQRFADTWTAGMPENDPEIVPPDGLYQPVRGFGKVWREQSGVRDGLGWALAPEQAFESARQAEHHEGSSSGAPLYLRIVDGRVIQLGMQVSGGWQFVTP